MKIKSKLFFAFAIVISLTVILGINSLVSVLDIGDDFTFLVEHDLNVLQNAQKLQKLVVDVETGQRGFVITGDETFLEPYYSGIKGFEELIEVEKELVSDNPPQVEKLEHIQELFEDWKEKAVIPEIEAARESHKLTDNFGQEKDNVADLLRAGTGKAILDNIRLEFDEFIKIENELKDQRFERVLSIETNAQNSTIIVGIASTIIGIIVSIALFRLINKPIIKLRDGFEKIGKDEFVQLEVSGNDELSDLTRSFNDMANNILQSKIIISDNLYKIKKQKEAIQKSEILKEEFTSMVTHELKSPLTPIKGYCEMLLDESFGTLSKNQVDFIKKIDSSAKSLERLIGDILDVQKLDLKKMSFNKDSLDLDKFLDELKQNNSHIMNEKGIEFIVSNSLNVILTTDSVRLRQIFDNIIKNAVDFVPSKNGKIEISANKENGKMIFHIKDNGIGIPKDKQKNIFKKFYQVDTSQTRKHGGTGLGLVICQGIVHGLGGKIWFESELGKGTTFSFEIPRDDKR